MLNNLRKNAAYRITGLGLLFLIEGTGMYDGRHFGTCQKSQMMYHGTVDGHRVEIFHEERILSRDIYSICEYDKNGRIVMKIRGHFQHNESDNTLHIKFDDGSIFNIGKNGQKKIVYPGGRIIRSKK